MDVKGKIITDVTMTRKLLRRGNIIIDIKPRHGNPEATVFVFRDDEKLNSDIQDIIDSVAIRR